MAIAIAILLPRTQTLHVEDFALHPRIRKLGYARQLWDDWRTLIHSTWTTTNSLTIEVYLHNVEPWRKIMDVSELVSQPLRLLPLVPDVPMMLMGHNLTAPVSDIFEEWQEIQREATALLKKLKGSAAHTTPRSRL